MRSSVSSILSDMSEPSALCYPDYQQVSSDHKRLLVLVRNISPEVLKPKTFARVYELLDRNAGNGITVNSADEVTRHVQVRLVRGNYPPENNEWGEFQHHRAVLGIVSVGAYRNQQEHGELGRLHETLKAKYAKFLLCSRLIALKEEEDVVAQDDSKARNNHYDDDVENESLPAADNSKTTSPHGKLEYTKQSLDEQSIESDVATFLSTLFWLLEKTRVEKQNLLDQSGAKVPLLCTPFERRDFVGLDLESRGNKRRTLARFKKHLGDLNLMCGLFREAYADYQQAVEVLKSCNDWLWLANSMEGICSIATLVHFPNLSRGSGLRRNSSYGALHSSPSAHQPMMSNSRKRDKNVKGLIENDESFRRKVISTRELEEFLKDIVVHYSKYRHAGVIETEASIKAVQVLIEQGNILFAAEFLQNIVFINLQMNDEEKVQRFAALSLLYSRIGFKRKAAFFFRVAAMRCVAPQNPHTDWAACYQLLLKTLSGYSIDFQSNSCLSTTGWPALQIQIMQELVGTARRMGDHAAAVRHMAFIVQTLFRFLSPTEKADLCQQLGILTARSPGTPVPHAIESGIILPPVNIYTVPRIVDFKPCLLAEPLLPPPSPTKSKSFCVTGGASAESSSSVLTSPDSSVSNPFIWTPIQSVALKRRALYWVQGEVASVELSVINPLPVELKIANMCLMTEGIEFDAFPSNFSLLPNSSEPHSIKLSGIPLKPGKLSLIGYSCVVFGVKSHCRIKALNILEESQESLVISVCPSIPKLELTNTTRKEHEKEHSDEISLFYGETHKVDLRLLNASSLMVEELQVTTQVSPLKWRSSLEIQHDCRRISPGETGLVHLILRGPATKCVSSAKKASKSKAPSFNATATIKYTSEKEVSKGYSRQLSRRMSVVLRPSLEVTWWDILPGEDSDSCYVILDIANRTEMEASLKYSRHKHIVVDPLGTCRIPVAVDKASSKEELGSYLDEKVDLQWELSPVSSPSPEPPANNPGDDAQRRSGRISLTDIQLTEAMSSRLALSSVSWSVTINGEKWTGRDFSLPVGPLNVGLTVSSSEAIKCRYFVKAAYYSDSTNSHSLPLSGASTFKKCEKGSSVSHNSRLIPPAPGKLSITYSCDVVRSNDDDAELFKTEALAIPCIYVNIS